MYTRQDKKKLKRHERMQKKHQKITTSASEKKELKTKKTKKQIEKIYRKWTTLPHKCNIKQNHFIKKPKQKKSLKKISIKKRKIQLLVFANGKARRI